MKYDAELKANLIAEAASEKKASDILIMKVRELTTTTDFFVITSANTQTQVRAIADNIEDKLKEKGLKMLRKEGYSTCEWVLLDFGDCVAHVFTKQAREFYALEELWGDAPSLVYED